MKNYISLLIILLSFSSLQAQNPLKGTWLTGEDNTKIETYEKEGAWYGKIVSSDNPKAKIGLDILRGFKQEGDTWKGKIFAAKRGKILDAKIDPAKDVLSIEASLGFMSRTLKWKRAEE